ncbi:hypothetical protein LCGC14_0319920 [marine sediment metagenome]|uniref:Uncharacterized protein n=1 Tax=marine sediment metagenome TaxID=412755 RepID=A0A0F9TPZ3_9ZZZZ
MVPNIKLKTEIEVTVESEMRWAVVWTSRLKPDDNHDFSDAHVMAMFNEKSKADAFCEDQCPTSGLVIYMGAE